MFQEKVEFAKKWFKDNNVQVPSGAKEWQRKSVRKGEIPPNCSVGKLRSLNINISDFIAAISNTESKKVSYDPITQTNIEYRIGLKWVDYTEIKGHKKINTICCSCEHREVLDYGTLQRMYSRKAYFCRICRKVGGKRKPLSFYDKFEDFYILDFDSNDKLIYKCNICNSSISRGIQHVLDSDYLVCDTCNPTVNTRITTELGVFDSKIEYVIYKYLLTIFKESDLVRQVYYRDFLKK